MINKKIIGLILAILTTASCSYPEKRVFTEDSRPTLLITGAKSGSSLFLDGVLVGPADKFNGNPNVLTVSSGKHEVVIKDDQGKVIHSEKVYLDGETKQITVGSSR